MAFNPKKIKFPSEKEILKNIEKKIDQEIQDSARYDPIKIRQECYISATIPEGYFNLLNLNKMLFQQLKDLYLQKGWREFKLNEEHKCLHEVELHYYFE